MIRLATVFSGIGAIEHALDRMQIEHKIVFACDNGDVDILSKEIPMNVDEIQNELESLKKLIKEIDQTSKDDLYKEELNLMLSKTQEEFLEVKHQLDIEYEDGLNLKLLSTLNKIIHMESLKRARFKEYSSFIKELQEERNKLDVCLKTYQFILQIFNDYKKDNAISDLGKPNKKYNSSDNIDWSLVSEELKDEYCLLEKHNGKKIIRKVKDLSQRTSMLHEKINSLKILNTLSEITDYKEKKRYVDSLYKGKERQNQVKKSYLANYKLDEEHFHWNVSFLDGTQYYDQVDLFVGGSPCQSFSLVGKQRGLEDTRGTLFYEYARLIKECNPKVFIYENVRAILSNDNGKTWETMKEVFNSLGYKVFYSIDGKPSVLNAKNYGIPQNRERMFVVGFRKDLLLSREFEFPQPIKLEHNMAYYLLDNVSGAYYLPQKGVDFVTSKKNLDKKFTQIDGEIALCQKKNQQFNWHGDFVFVEPNENMEKTMVELEKYFLSPKVEKYVLSSGTKNFYSKPKTDLEVARPLLQSMHKMHRAGVDNYVHTEGRLRKLTPRECLRLMGFCDSFKIVVSDTSMYQQAGNSIVVNVLMAIMEEVLKAYPNLNS